MTPSDRSKSMKPRFRPVIRVFVSSTFSDLKAERNILQSKVFPSLEQYCLLRGFQFQAIDLRWGVSGEAGLDHRTMQICFDELRRAQEVSPKPNFLVLLGDRYGWQPLAERVTEKEFQTLEEAARQQNKTSSAAQTKESTTQILHTWYRRDDNADPVEYLLRSRYDSPDGRDFCTETYDADGQKIRNPHWVQVEARLWAIINRAYPPGDLSSRFGHIPTLDDPLPAIVKFQASATEQEIWRGALAVRDAKDHVVAWYRTIRNHSQYLSDERAKDFFDKDAALHGAASKLREELSRKLRKEDERGITSVEVDLRPTDSGKRVEVTHDHLATICNDIEKNLVQIIEKEISEYWRPTIGGHGLHAPVEATGPSEARKLELERMAHDQFGESRAPKDRFVGREKELESIDKYLRDEADCRLLVVYGPSGTGKTALLARAAQLAIDNKDTGRRIFVRFLGTTAQSSNLRSLLANLCRALRPPEEVEKEVSAELHELQDEFNKNLASATPDKPIVLFLDALDQLDEADGTRRIYWLRTPLPPHVKVVVSCIYDAGDTNAVNEPYLALERRRALEDQDGQHRDIPVESLPANEAMELLNRWLDRADPRGRQKRRLTNDQRKAIETHIAPDAATACRRPLYLRLLFEQCRLWPSYNEEVKPVDLGENTAALLQALFEHLAQPAMHGRILVESILGYIAAARRGLSENEMLELLWADPEYKQHLDAETKKTKHELPAEATRIPIAIWSRLRQDLDPYLAEQAAPGGAVLNFYHREVGRVVAERFLSDPGRRVLRHGRLAEYFERQPWWREPEASRRLIDAPADRRWPNARKADELPAQWLTVARSAAEGGIASERDLAATAVEQLFQRLDFLEAKAEAGLVSDLVADFAGAVKATSEDRPNLRVLRVLERALRRDASVIIQRPHLLLQFLWHTCYWHDSPRTPKHCVWGSRNDARKPSWPWNKPGPKLFELMDRWLDEVKHNPRQHPWLRSCRPSGVSLNSPLIAVLRGHEAEVASVAVTPDGRLIVSGSEDKTVRVWDADGGAELAVLRGQHAVYSVAVTSDGRRIVSASLDGVRVWDADRGAELAVLRAHDSVQRVAVTPDGQRIVSGSYQNTVQVWDGESGAELDARSWNPLSLLTGVAVTADGRRIVSAATSRDETVDWAFDWRRARDLEQMAALDGYEFPDNTVRVWDADGGANLIVLRVPESEGKVSSVAMTPDGRRIVSGASRRYTAKGSGSESVREAQEIERGFGSHVVFSPAVGGKASEEKHAGFLPSLIRRIMRGTPSVRVWDPESGGKRLAPWFLAGMAVTALGIFQSWKRGAPLTVRSVGIVLAVLGVFIMYKVKRRMLVAILRGHEGAVNSVAVTSDGRRIVSGSSDKTVRVWTPAGQAELAILRGHEDTVNSVAVTSDGRRIVSGSRDKTVRLWDGDGGSEPGILRGHEGLVGIIAITPDGRRIVSGSEDKTVRVWDADSGAELAVLRGHEHDITSVAVTPDGRRVVSGSWDDAALKGADSEVPWVPDDPRQRFGTQFVALDIGLGLVIYHGSLRVWDVDSGREVVVLRGHEDWISSIAVTPDGHRIVSGGHRDETVRVWDAESGAQLAVLRGHEDFITSVAVTPDGRRIVSGSHDKTVRVWDGESGAELAVLRGHEFDVQSVGVTPDGREVKATDSNGRTQTWSLDWLAATAPTAFPVPEFYWPGGSVTLCESGEYAVAVCQNEVIPCKVEASSLPPAPAIAPDTRDAAYVASLRRGLDRRRREKGPEHEETLAHLVALAHHLGRMGKTDEARSLREEYDRIKRRLAGREEHERQRSAALEAYRTGDYAHAERLLRSLIVNGFEVPSTHCHLGRILLIQDRFAEARTETAAAWEHYAEAPSYVIPRILWLRLALLYTSPTEGAVRDSAPVILGRLKTALAREGAHDVQWTMDPVLAHLQPILPADRYHLLAALVAALSDATNIPALEEFPAWRDAQPEPHW